MYILGWTKRSFPGCVKLGEKVEVLLTTERNFLHPTFTQPGKVRLVQPLHNAFIVAKAFVGRETCLESKQGIQKYAEIFSDVACNIKANILLDE